jgi:hypothetical protein
MDVQKIVISAVIRDRSYALISSKNSRCSSKRQIDAVSKILKCIVYKVMTISTILGLYRSETLLKKYRNVIKILTHSMEILKIVKRPAKLETIREQDVRKETGAPITQSVWRRAMGWTAEERRFNFHQAQETFLLSTTSIPVLRPTQHPIEWGKAAGVRSWPLTSI